MSRQRNPSLALVLYLDLLEYIKTSKQIDPPLENVDEVVKKFDAQKLLLLETVWAIISNWGGDLKRFKNIYDMFKEAVMKDFKGYVECVNSAFVVVSLPAKHEDRKYTLKVVKGLQVFDLPKCGVHIKNMVRLFNLLTADSANNETKNTESVNMIKVLIILIMQSFRILSLDDSLLKEATTEKEHVHGPHCNHEHHHHDHEHHHHDHTHEHTHEHGPDCKHDQEHHHHEHTQEHTHEHGPDCKHEHEQLEQVHEHGPDCKHDHEHHHHEHTHEHTHENTHEHGPDCKHDHEQQEQQGQQEQAHVHGPDCNHTEEVKESKEEDKSKQKEVKETEKKTKNIETGPTKKRPNQNQKNRTKK